MKPLLLTASALGLVAASAAWVQLAPPPLVATPTAATQITPSRAEPGRPTAAAGEVNAQDREFVAAAGGNGLAEVEIGRLAEEQAQDRAVQDFARWMASDHAMMNHHFDAVARQAGVAAPQQLSLADRAAYDALKDLSGRQFDQRYLQDQLHRHEQTIALCHKEKADGRNPGLRDLARAAIPALEKQFEQVRALANAWVASDRP